MLSQNNYLYVPTSCSRAIAARAQPTRGWTRVFAIIPSGFWAILAALAAAYDTRLMKASNCSLRVLAVGVFMEDEHVIRGPQTAGEGRRVTVLVSYISLANYMSRRGS